MSVSRTRKFTSFKNALLIKVCSAISLLTMAAMTLLFARGCAAFGGRAVSVRRAITLTLSIFKMGKAYYRTFAGVFIGLSFIIILVIMIRRLIDSYKFFVFLSFNKRDSNKIVTMGLDPLEAKEKYTFAMCAHIGDNLVSVLKFVAICALFGDSYLSREFLFIAFVGAAVFLLTRSLYYLLKGCSAKTFGLQLVFNFMLLLTAALMFVQSRVPAADGLRSYIPVLSDFFNGNLELDILFSIIALIIQILILFTVIGALKDANSYASVFNSDTESKALRVFIFTIILAIMPVILLIVDGEDPDIDVMKSLIEPYFALVVSSLAMLFASKLDVPEEKKKVVRKQIGQVDERGILRISEFITRIYDNEFEERRDINAVIIPSSVVEMGRNVFYGCGAITAIYCDFPSKPDGWDKGWNNGCYATVYWRTSDGRYK